jgi:RHS repeat-associated protein
VTTTYTYDALNRVTQVSYNVGSTLVTSTSTVSYTYDYGGSSAYALGRLTSMSDGLGTGSETYTYDQIGRVTQLQKGASGVAYITNYLYNVASEPIKITYPSGRIVESAYNTIGQLCGVGQSVSGCTVTTPYASSFSYDAPGHVTGFTYGNGVTASLAYSTNRLQLSSLAYANGSTTLFSLNYYYTYNSSYCPTGTAGNNGQIQCIADNTPATGSNGRNAVYSYDPLGRLSTASTAGTSAYPAWGLSFAYDRYGNRPTQSILSGCTGLTCPTSSLTISTSTNQVTGTGFSYDANGNMQYDGYNTLLYDAASSLIHVSNGSADVAYLNDGNGRRVEKCLISCSSSSSRTIYIFSGSKVIAEYAGGASASSPSEEYLYAGGQLISTVDSSMRYHHQDHLSVRLTTDTSGNLLGQQGHFPFGESWYLTSTTTKWEFTTYERDVESGNDYAMARYHVNRLGRFSSVDPVQGPVANPQSLNRYAYAINDPVNAVDPTGKVLCGVSDDQNQSCTSVEMMDSGTDVNSLGFGGCVECEMDFGFLEMYYSYENAIWNAGLIADSLGGAFHEGDITWNGNQVASMSGEIDFYGVNAGGEDDPPAMDLDLLFEGMLGNGAAPIWCTKSFMDAAQKSYDESRQAPAHTEYGFSMAANGTITTTFGPGYSCLIPITYQPGVSVLTFHTHPPGCENKPSENYDVPNAQKTGLPFYVGSWDGLWVTQSGNSTPLATGATPKNWFGSCGQ